MTLKKQIVIRFFCLIFACVSPALHAQADLQRLQLLAQQRYGEIGSETVSNWRNLLKQSATLDELEKLQQINNFFNLRIRFESDRSVWQQSDYWATPLETMGRARGDCEDFSIAKYVSLLILGVPLEKLKITYVNARRGNVQNPVNQAHMVVAYYPDSNADPLILDNLVADIRPASQRSDLKPIFSFNSAGLWVAGENRASKPEARLSKWRDVLNRMHTEGL